LIGVGLSRIYSYENDDLSVYGTDVATSVLKIGNVSYPFWIAPIKAFEESGRLSVLTAQTFVDVIKSLVTKFVVPEGVAGVVGIAQLTHVYVQAGALPLLRFVALLSLSLAMINIFPIPALDGGKLLFILVEAVSGRKVNQKFESIVHMIGFALLMLLILVITYSDIVRIFTP
jgi:regulator of sigma E protease